MLCNTYRNSQKINRPKKYQKAEVAKDKYLCCLRPVIYVAKIIMKCAKIVAGHLACSPIPGHSMKAVLK